MITASLLPVVAAGLAMFLLGHIWYHRKVFGGVWMRLTNLTPETAEEGKRRSFFYSVVSLLAAIVLASAMQYVGQLVGVYGALQGVVFAASIWIGFMVPALVGQVLWEGKAARLYAINAGYWLAALIVASLLLFI